MNTAAPDPSAASKARALSEFAVLDLAGMQDLIGFHATEIVYSRAREIDASAPAAAVGGDYSDWLLRLAKEIHSGSERRDAKQWGHESERVRARFLRYAEAADCTVRCQVRREQAATPAAPVGGFVVDDPENWGGIDQRAKDWANNTCRGWLIEFDRVRQNDKRPPSWWKGYESREERQYPYGWTEDSNDAMRFVRKDDAIRAMHMFGLDSHMVTEHVWIAASPAAQSFDDESTDYRCPECGKLNYKPLGCMNCGYESDAAQSPPHETLCEDCPPTDEGDKFRCTPCPRRDRKHVFVGDPNSAGHVHYCLKCGAVEGIETTPKECAAQSSAKDGVRVQRWPFVESPGDFTERLRDAMNRFPLIGAVRHVLIEDPPTIATTGAGLVDGECEWAFDDMWESACGVSWEFTNDGPAENNYRFCHGCGKPIKIVEAAIGREVSK